MRILAAGLVGWLAVGTWASAAAEEIGKVARVRSEVFALEAGKRPRQLVRLDPVQNGLRVRLTLPDSLLAVAFYDGRKPPLVREGVRDLRIDGTFRFSGPSEALVSQRQPDSNRVITKVNAFWGSLLLALRPGQGHEAEIETPDLVSGIKGTRVRVWVDQEVGTFIAVDEGLATVQALAGGDPVVLRSGQWVFVPRGGVPTLPAPPDGGVDILDDPPLLNPEERPVLDLPKADWP